MDRPRSASVVLALIVVLAVPASVAPALASAPPDDARLTVTDVSVSPATPTTSGPVTLSVALRNSAGSPSSVQVDNLTVRTEDGGRTLARTTDPGTLSPGDTLTVPLTTTFETAGTKRLVVVAAGTDAEGNVTRVRRPLTVVVERAPPQLELDLEGAVAGQRTTASVAVSNPTNGPLRNLTVTLAGEGVEPLDARRTLPDLGAGQRAVFNLTLRPRAAGERTLRLEARYTTAAGTSAATNRSFTLQVRPARRDLGVRAGRAPQQDQPAAAGQLQGILGGGRTTEPESDDQRPRRVEVTVTNFGNAPARGVVVLVRVGQRRLPRQAVASALAPGESASTTVDLSSVERPSAVQFTARATVAGENATAATVYDYRPEVGAIRLTGLELSFTEEGTLKVAGNAGNVGTAEVSGVVVSVGNSTYVDPAYPRRTYFVGAVDASEFAPFEVTAEVDADNVSSIPVTVEYSVAGATVNRTVEVPYDEDIERPAPDEGGIDLWFVGGGLAVVLVVGAVAWLYRRRE